MPVLTKEQVVEAAFELLPEEREEVAKRIVGDEFELSEEQKDEIRHRIEDDRRNPSTSISRDQLRSSLRAAS